MVKRVKILLLVGAFILMFGAGGSRADETALFTTVAPDLLFLLDMSGSMYESPSGDPRQVYNPDAACMGPYWYSGRGFTGGPLFTDCRRYTIAKRAIFSIMDDNHDGLITSADEASLNVRIGYGVFWTGEADFNYIQQPIGTPYATLFCNGTSCNSADTGYGNYCWSRTPPVASNCIFCETGGGATPLNPMLDVTKTYLDQSRAADSAQNCRQKFVILMTDGQDTISCGRPYNYQPTLYKNRRTTVLKVKALRDAGYKVFVVGMGADMPATERNTLEWMAYYGGTDNPMVANAGSTAALNPSAFSANSCAADSAPPTGPDCANSPDYGPNCWATSNDPGDYNNLSLSGYAFITRNSDELMTALRQAINQVRAANYSFATSSVASARLQDENNIYEASFQPVSGDPMWLGHLKKYAINTDGTVGSALWDAGTVLQSTADTARNIYTLLGGVWKTFTTAHIHPDDLELSSSDHDSRDMVVGYIRGSATYNQDNWKLGDIFRSAPVTVGSPSPGFGDSRDSANAFNSYRTTNTRSSANGKRILLAGANDGQLHAFRADTGAEVWSFIPPNLLGKLKNLAHNAHPTGLSHAYFVDGPISVGDVWMGTGDGKTKSASDWKTMVVFGYGRGGADNLWSTSSNCDSDFASMYSTKTDINGNVLGTYSHYCGYHALDITTTASPVYKWRIHHTAGSAPYFGEPWSKLYFGRVIVGGNEKWLGFLGGGHNMSHCPGGTDCDTRGKGFFTVDVSDGSIYWSYTRADNTAKMNYAFPAPAALLDTDNDGFIDTAYIGDLGGNIWRFKFCTQAMGDSCNKANWSATLLLDATGSGNRPIYSIPAASRDAYGNLWVYWGTGDKVNPTTSGTQDRFFAVKDSDLTSTWTIADLENVSSSTYSDNATKKGWYINLPVGEKVLAEATVFGGVAYFTSYSPAAAGADACSQAGSGNLYSVGYVTGAGTLSGNARKTTLGVGIPTAPTISLNPAGTRPDLYVTLSGGAGTSASTVRAPVNPPYVSNRTNILLWQDLRVQ